MHRYGWSLRQDEWRQLTEALEGSDWHYTNLNNKFHASVPSEPGIYLLISSKEYVSRIYGLPPELSSALYVGRSNNLKTRFKQHASDHTANRFIRESKNTFGTLRYAYTKVPLTRTVSVDDWLSNAERLLILVLGPPANSNIPTSASLVGKFGTPVSI